MNQKTQTYKITWWPSPQDYNEAVQTPTYSYADPLLQCGKAESTILGIPRPRSGTFASVYKVHCDNSVWAVRCFLHRADGLDSRYIEIARSIKLCGLPYFADFEFLEKGIRIRNEWFPILKMEWLEGLTLTEFIDKNVSSPAKIAETANEFKRVMLDLQKHGIAHGDIQHGNLIVSQNQLRLVDYDGMFVQTFAQSPSPELGHRNYQHPQRLPQHFNDRLDDFAAWIVYGCLQILSKDPTLWSTIKKSGDDCLLFKRTDYIQTEQSWAFYQLDHHANTEIRRISRFVRWLCRQPFNTVPRFTGEFAEISDLPELEEPPPPPADQFAPPSPTIVSLDQSGAPWYQGQSVHSHTSTKANAQGPPLTTHIHPAPAPPPYAVPKQSYLNVQIGAFVGLVFAATIVFNVFHSTISPAPTGHKTDQKQTAEPVDVTPTKLPGLSLANSLMIKGERARKARMYEAAEKLLGMAIREFESENDSRNQESIGLCQHSLGHVKGHVRGHEAAYTMFLSAQKTLKDLPRCRDLCAKLSQDLAESAERARDYKNAAAHYMECLLNPPASKPSQPFADSAVKMVDAYTLNTANPDYKIYNQVADVLFATQQFQALTDLTTTLVNSALRHTSKNQIATARLELDLAHGIIARAPKNFPSSLTTKIEQAELTLTQQK